MNIKRKAEKTKHLIIEQSAPIFNSEGIVGDAEATNKKAITPMTLLEQYIAG